MALGGIRDFINSKSPLIITCSFNDWGEPLRRCVFTEKVWPEELHKGYGAPVKNSRSFTSIKLNLSSCCYALKSIFTNPFCFQLHSSSGWFDMTLGSCQSREVLV